MEEFGDTISRSSRHLGHDWGVCVGTKVKAAKEGRVTLAYYSESYGYNVLINQWRFCGNRDMLICRN